MSYNEISEHENEQCNINIKILFSELGWKSGMIRNVKNTVRALGFYGGFSFQFLKSRWHRLDAFASCGHSSADTEPDCQTSRTPDHDNRWKEPESRRL